MLPLDGPGKMVRIDRFKKHTSKQVDRWLADHAELQEALIDIDAGRITGISSERRKELEAAIQKITGAIAHLDTFNDERQARRAAR